MRFWLFCAAVVFLTAFLISACGSYLLVNMSRIEGKRITTGQGRQRDPSGTKLERLYLSRLKREEEEEDCLEKNSSCSTNCPAGKFLNCCTCENCSDESYMAYDNNFTICFPCKTCNSVAYQVEVESCTTTQNRKCGCVRGRYKVLDHSEKKDGDFSCQRCKDCGTLNKQTEKNCSENEDAKCGACLPSFAAQGDVCQPRTPENIIVTTTPIITKAPELPSEPKKPGFKPEYLFFCLPFLFLLIGSVIYGMWRCKTKTSSSVGVDTLANSTCIDMLLSAAGAVSSPKYKSEEAPEFPSSLSPSQVQRGLPRADPSPHHSLLQGRKLYAVIDAVPARRWKEFVRGLGLRDGEIESVEVEHRQLREQQYEMLKRWRQQQGATVDAIFAVLEDMQLGGCAHELREQLQPSNLLPSHL